MHIEMSIKSMTKERIYALSDLHVDQKENMQWIEQISTSDYLNDTIIIAGDVTHVLAKLFQTLQIFQSRFRNVYFCPGNHDLWTKSQKEDECLNIYDSIEKFHYIMDTCDQMGVHTKPGITAQGVKIIPLFSWYDDSLHIPMEGLTSDLAIWSDTYRCVWTKDVSQSRAAKYFTQLNQSYLDSWKSEGDQSKIITFSHFLTSKKLMEAYRQELINRRSQWRQSEDGGPGRQEAAAGVTRANFSLVAGTELLNEQLQIIKPKVHIFGHSHRKMELNIDDGIRYINNPLGYVFERESGLIEPPHRLYEIQIPD